MYAKKMTSKPWIFSSLALYLITSSLITSSLIIIHYLGIITISISSKSVSLTLLYIQLTDVIL